MRGNRRAEEGLEVRHLKQRKPRTRARLLRRMVEVAAELGYAASSVDRVIGGTGIARSTFYDHFADKAACFLAALQALTEDLLNEVRAVAETEGQGAEVVVKALVDFAREHPESAKVLFVESLAGGARSLQLRDSLLEACAELIEGGWRRQTPGLGEMDVPARGLVGGAFRLLAIRLGREDPELGSLGEDLTAWSASYRRETKPPRWRGEVRLNSPSHWAGASLPSLDPGSGQGGARRLRGRQLARSQRLAILHAVTKCVYELGYDRVTVANVITTAEVSRKAFYKHFTEKADAATAADERIFQAGMTACAAGFFSTAAWPQRAWDGGLALLSFLAAHPEDAYLAFVESTSVGRPTTKVVYERLVAFTLFLEDGFKMRPEAEALPKATSEALAATMFEWAFQELHEHRNADRLLETLPQFVYMVLAPFLGPEAAGEFIEQKMAETEAS
jgi:AcrR family transcriptional regulator